MLLVIASGIAILFQENIMKALGNFWNYYSPYNLYDFNIESIGLKKPKFIYKNIKASYKDIEQ